MNYEDFYTQLGKLAYAVAMADGTVQQEEIDKFRDDIKELLLPLESGADEFGIDNAFFSEFEFKSLMDKKIGVEETFESFLNFIDKNKESIDDNLKEVCLKVVENVALAYQGIVESEKLLIDKLKEKLNSL